MQTLQVRLSVEQLVLDESLRLCLPFCTVHAMMSSEQCTVDMCCAALQLRLVDELATPQQIATVVGLLQCLSMSSRCKLLELLTVAGKCMNSDRTVEHSAMSSLALMQAAPASTRYRPASSRLLRHCTVHT